MKHDGELDVCSHKRMTLSSKAVLVMTLLILITSECVCTLKVLRWGDEVECV